MNPIFGNNISSGSLKGFGSAERLLWEGDISSSKSAFRQWRPEATAGQVARCEAAIFDCDGLLLDTAAAWSHAFDAGAGAAGYQLTRREHAQLLGSSVRSAAGRIAGWAERPDRTECIADEVRAGLHAAIHADAPRVLPGVVTLLAQLRRHVRLGVASNAPEDILIDLLTTTGLRNAFLEIVSADVVTEPKPAPDVYLATCARLGVDPSAATAFEDSRAGAIAAQSAGMSVVVATANGWPADAPLAWPAQGRPVLYVTSLGDPAVATYVLGAASWLEVAE